MAAILLFTENLGVAQTCSCKEYVYLNEPAAQKVLKFEVKTSTISLMSDTIPNKMTGKVPWHKGGPAADQLSSPHGIAFDNQGFLYIGETGLSNSHIRRLTCDGEIVPETSFRIPNSNMPQTGQKQNLFAIGNILFSNDLGGPQAWSTCSGNDTLGQARVGYYDGPDGRSGNLIQMPQDSAPKVSTLPTTSCSSQLNFLPASNSMVAGRLYC